MKLLLRVQINGDGWGVFRPAAAAAAAATATTDDDDDAAAAAITATIDMVVPQSVVESLVDKVASEVLKKLVLKKQLVVNIDKYWTNDQKLAPTHTTVDDDVPPLHNLSFDADNPFDDDSTVYDSQSGDGSTDNDMDEDNQSPDLLESSSEEDDDKDDDDDDDDNDVDDEAGDLPVAPVAATYEVNQGKEEIYKLSQAMNMLRTNQDYNNN